VTREYNGLSAADGFWNFSLVIIILILIDPHASLTTLRNKKNNVAVQKLIMEQAYKHANSIETYKKIHA
jgi:hypothetical protein